MISKYKRVGCFVLSLVLMFLLFATPIVQPKADAFAITASVATISIVVSLLALLGISFATVDAAKAGADSFVRTNPDILSWVDNVKVGSGCPGDPGFSPDGKPSMFFNAANTAGLVTFFNKAKEFFNKKGEGNVEVVDPNFKTYFNVPVLSSVNNLSNFSSKELFDFAPYSENSKVTLSLNGVDYNYSFKIRPSFNSWTPVLYLNDKPCVDDDGALLCCAFYTLEAQNSYNNTLKFGFYLYYPCSTSSSPVTICPYVALRSVDKSTGLVSYTHHYCVSTLYGSYPLNAENLASAKIKVPYKNSPKYDPQSVIDQLLQTIEKQGSVTVDYKKTLDAIENNQDTQIQIDQEQLVTEIGIKDKLDEIAQNQPKPEDDMTVPKLPSLNDKFPFCIPFDLIHLIQALSATPKPPKWEIPFKFPSFGVDESLTLDLTRYETVAEIIRITTVISFIFFLILVTRRLIKG